MWKALGLLSVLSITLPLATATTAMPVPTTAALYRTFMIDYGGTRATAFSIDVDGREYWITAKHVFGKSNNAPKKDSYSYGKIPEGPITLQVFSASGLWVTERFVPVNGDSDEHIDIAVLAPEKPLINGLHQSVKFEGGYTLGDDCVFLGFPFAQSWTAKFTGGGQGELPFTKHCVISAEVLTPGRHLLLDGINNQGFSGGPVLYKNLTDQSVLAVVSGYIPEPADVEATEDGNPTEKVSVNSGFIVAYPIEEAITAIRKNPIGPLLQSPTIK